MPTDSTTMVSVSSAADRLRHLYESRAADAQQFRYGLVAFDVITILFIIATSFVPRHRAIETLDLVFGLLILADFSARLVISRQSSAAARPAAPRHLG
jgi:voltage-gated potassium channel